MSMNLSPSRLKISKQFFVSFSLLCPAKVHCPLNLNHFQAIVMNWSWSEVDLTYIFQFRCPGRRNSLTRLQVWIVPFNRMNDRSRRIQVVALACLLTLLSGKMPISLCSYGMRMEAHRYSIICDTDQVVVLAWRTRTVMSMIIDHHASATGFDLVSVSADWEGIPLYLSAVSSADITYRIDEYADLLPLLTSRTLTGYLAKSVASSTRDI